MIYGKYKVLRDKAFEIASNPKYVKEKFILLLRTIFGLLI